MTVRQALSTHGETRRLLALAWPVVLTSLNWTLLQVTDVMVVGLVATEEVAALGASRALGFVGIVAGLSWLSGVLVMASRADGAGDLPRTGGVLREGLVLGLLLGVAIGGLFLVAAEPLLALVGVAADRIDESARVVRAFAIAFPFQLVNVAAAFFLEGVSRPGRVAAVNLSILPVNAVLAWALSAGHLGLPALGAVGAALATSIASLLGAAGMVASALTLPRARTREVRRTDRAAWASVPRGVVALAAFGLVPAIASGLELAGFSILIALSTQLGDVAAHAFQIVFSIHNVTFAIAIGLGSAAGVRAGNAVGEGQPAAAIPRTLIAVALAIAALGLLVLVLWAATPGIVALFPATAPVHVLGTAMLAVWAPFIVFDGIQVVLMYALRSLGDQVVAGINSILAYFIASGGLGWWLVHHGMGPMALVWASGLGMVAAAVLHGGRFAFMGWRLRRQS
ncbi:MATE family efflux transporter [Sphingomonas sp. S6]|jgi:MATE family multidrug resistance protein|uniref:MATE family efflux transporter n=1 Tax=Sphingomonas sp. S6 TaxID=3368600 RepID=UPI000F9042EC|nr:MATE family efflux transporter [uncultured Sphingomonas sp.]RTL15401.1 MAG: MATE family efflux transporter [Sphingomonadaceae bacterium]